MRVTMNPILKFDGKNIDLSKVLVVSDPTLCGTTETYYTNLTMATDGVKVDIQLDLCSCMDIEANGMSAESDLRKEVREVFSAHDDFETLKLAHTKLKDKLESIFPDGAVRYKGSDTIIEFKGLHHNTLIELLEDSWSEKVVDLYGNGRYYNVAAEKVEQLIKLWVEYKDK